jgi:hypothetical protein
MANDSHLRAPVTNHMVQGTDSFVFVLRSDLRRSGRSTTMSEFGPCTIWFVIVARWCESSAISSKGSHGRREGGQKEGQEDFKAGYVSRKEAQQQTISVVKSLGALHCPCSSIFKEQKRRTYTGDRCGCFLSGSSTDNTEPPKLYTTGRVCCCGPFLDTSRT